MLSRPFCDDTKISVDIRPDCMRAVPAADTQTCLALCGCDIEGLTAWAEGVKVCGSKGEQVTGHWRKLHTEKLHGLYCTSDTVRLIEWAGHVVFIW